MIDFHTHRLDATDAIISLQPTQAADIIASRPHGTYSVGIHPWDTTAPAAADFDTVARLASLPQVVAIGETGLDRLRGADIATQELLFEQHIQLSETLRKPLIIHCVKAWDILLELHRRHRPSMPWGGSGYDPVP